MRALQALVCKCTSSLKALIDTKMLLKALRPCSSSLRRLFLVVSTLKKKIYIYTRPKKINCLFPVTARKKIG